MSSFPEPPYAWSACTVVWEVGAREGSAYPISSGDVLQRIDIFVLPVDTDILIR